MAPSNTAFAPNLETFLRSLKGKGTFDSSVESLIALLKRRQITGPQSCAIATANIMIQIVAKGRWSDVDQLLDLVERTGHKIVDSQPRELVISNIVRRVLALIKDEALEDRGNDLDSEAFSDSQATPATEEAPAPPPKPVRPPTLSSVSSFIVPQTMLSLLSAEPVLDGLSVTGSGASTPIAAIQPASIHALRSEVIDGIEEIKDEIMSVDDQVAGFADIQIYPGDVIMVYQPSPTVEKFLVKAASRRRFTVLLAGESPRKSEETPYAYLRKKLSSAKVNTIVITGPGAAAYMPKVSKVILGANALLASGGVLSESGSSLLAHTAHELGKPVIVLGGVFQISPTNSADGASLMDWGDPSGIAKYSDGPIVDGVEVENAITDFIPPHLVDVIITNLGAHSRDQLPGIIADHYKQFDLELSTQ